MVRSNFGAEPLCLHEQNFYKLWTCNYWLPSSYKINYRSTTPSWLQLIDMRVIYQSDKKDQFFVDWLKFGKVCFFFLFRNLNFVSKGN